MGRSARRCWEKGWGGSGRADRATTHVSGSPVCHQKCTRNPSKERLTGVEAGLLLWLAPRVSNYCTVERMTLPKIRRGAHSLLPGPRRSASPVSQRKCQGDRTVCPRRPTTDKPRWGPQQTPAGLGSRAPLHVASPPTTPVTPHACPRPDGQAVLPKLLCSGCGRYKRGTANKQSR